MMPYDYYGSDYPGNLERLEQRLLAAQLARDHALAAELTEAIERLHDKGEE